MTPPNNATKLVLIAGMVKVAEANHTVYTLRDPITFDVKYVGRTKNPKVRKLNHRLTPGKENLVFTPEKSKLNYPQARGLEQILFNKYGGIDKLLNKIRPIKLKNPNYSQYIKEAIKIFKQGEN